MSGLSWDGAREVSSPQSCRKEVLRAGNLWSLNRFPPALPLALFINLWEIDDLGPLETLRPEGFLADRELDRAFWKEEKGFTQESDVELYYKL